MIPVATASGGKVDVAAHFGGALAGAAVGLVILALWPRDEVRPRLAPLAGTVALIGLAFFAFAFTPLPKNHRQTAFLAALIPAEQFPKVDDEGRKRSAELVEKFPRDPRSHLFRTYALWIDGDRPAAEKAARAGLAEEAFWRPLLNPEIAVRLHAALALILNEEGRTAEAKEAAKVACELASSGRQRELLDQNGLCAP
jgi:rhomboid protease GluP